MRNAAFLLLTQGTARPPHPQEPAQGTGAERRHLMGCVGSASRLVGSKKAQLFPAGARKPGFLLTHVSRVFSVASLASNKANASSWEQQDLSLLASKSSSSSAPQGLAETSWICEGRAEAVIRKEEQAELLHPLCLGNQAKTDKTFAKVFLSTFSKLKCSSFSLKMTLLLRKSALKRVR